MEIFDKKEITIFHVLVIRSSKYLESFFLQNKKEKIKLMTMLFYILYISIYLYYLLSFEYLKFFHLLNLFKIIQYSRNNFSRTKTRR